MSEGRLCPLAYRYQPEQVCSDPEPISSDVLYVIGGLYGNGVALDEIEAMADRERSAGHDVSLVFNGDFNWFNATPDQLRAITERVLNHRALMGNVEYEIANATPGSGCGCAYPDSVAQAVVDRSNRIMEKLQIAAEGQDDLKKALKQLPRWRYLVFGGLKIAVLHGDPESLAGWGLSRESLTTSEGVEQLKQWFAAMDADIVLCTHTCLPLLWQANVEGRLRTLINNGSAGMGNLQSDPDGLLIRLARSSGNTSTKSAATAASNPKTPAVASLEHGLLSLSLSRISFDLSSWIDAFDQLWPRGSEAAVSYRERICTGTNLPSRRLRIS